MSQHASALEGRSRSRVWDQLFALCGLVVMFAAMVTLCGLLMHLAQDGASRLDAEFFFSFPSRFPEMAGILSAWVGSFLVMIVTAATGVPLGILAGTYLEEYARKNRLTALIEINILNLAGVPSIVYGLMALGLFVHFFRLGQTVLTAGLTLGLLILPVVITATREAIRTVPRQVREAAYALGATQWQTTCHHVLPYSMGGILTGTVIALSRAVGETAPLVTIGALSYIAFLPDSPIQGAFPFVSFDWLMAPFTVLPIQMFNWVSRPQEEFHRNAAATGLVLISLTFLLNLVAIVLRYRVRRRIKW